MDVRIDREAPAAGRRRRHRAALRPRPVRQQPEGRAAAVAAERRDDQVGAVRLEGRHLVSRQARGAESEGRHRRACAARRGRAARPSRRRGSSRRSTSMGHKTGSPGLYADAPWGASFDNIKVYRDDGSDSRSSCTRPRRRPSSSPPPPPPSAATARPMAGATDWPMWGGTPSRNMVSAATGLPDKWDVKTKTNVKWVADLGSQTYGNATVAGGKVFVGTNNELLRDPKQTGDRGVLMAFKRGHRRVPVADHAREAGRRPRQRLAVPGHRQLAAGRGRQDLLRQQPRRADVPRHRGLPRRQRERRPGHRREARPAETDADIIWKFDMMEEVGAFPHNLVELVAGRPRRPRST